MAEDEKSQVPPDESADAPDADAPPTADVEPVDGKVESPLGDDSVTFTRCSACRHSEDVDATAGTLLCGKHSMRIDAEADEIPDDCPDYEPR